MLRGRAFRSRRRGGHGEVHGAVTVVDRGIDEDGVTGGQPDLGFEAA
ncbi:MAG TPA: hypothetical protein VGM48_19880 [Puia sp.]